MYQTCGLAFDHPELPKIVTVFSDSPQIIPSSYPQDNLGTAINVYNAPYPEDGSGFSMQYPPNSQGAVMNTNNVSRTNKEALYAFIHNRRARFNAETAKVTSRHALKEVYRHLPTTHIHGRAQRLAVPDLRNRRNLPPQIPNQALNRISKPMDGGNYCNDILYTRPHYPGMMQGFQHKSSHDAPSPLSTETSNRFFDLLAKHKNIDWPKVYETAKLLLRPRYNAGFPVTRQEVFYAIGSAIKLLHGKNQAGLRETPAGVPDSKDKYSLGTLKNMCSDEDLSNTKFMPSDVQPDVAEGCKFLHNSTLGMPAQNQLPLVTGDYEQPFVNVKQEPSFEFLDYGSSLSCDSVRSVSSIPNQETKLEPNESEMSLFETLTSMEGMPAQCQQTWESKFVSDKKIKQEDTVGVYRLPAILNDDELLSDLKNSADSEGTYGQNLINRDQKDSQSNFCTNLIAVISNIKREKNENVETEVAFQGRRESNMEYNIFDVLHEL